MNSKLINVKPFMFYAQKVLPTVYSDALSYQEVLMKIAQKLDEVIASNNAQNEVIENLPEDVSQFAEMLAEFKRAMEGEFDSFTDAINQSIQEFEDEVNGKIVTDDTPTQGSTNLVTSGGVYASIKSLSDTLVKDLVPTENSHNYVESGGVYSAIQTAIGNLSTAIATKQDRLTFDTEPTQNSVNPVQSGGIYTAIEQAKTDAANALGLYAETTDETIGEIQGDIETLNNTKQDELDWDATPTEGSTNPVTSEGIRRAIDEAVPEIQIDPSPTSGSQNAVSSNGTYQAIQTLNNNINVALAAKQDKLTWDLMPTQNSLNPVTSGGVYEALGQIDPSITIDGYPTEGSPHAVASGGVYAYVANIETDLESAINGKQATLTWDTTPTLGSLNPVTSDGIKRAIDAGGGGGGGTIDPVPTEDSPNAVSSGGVYDALEGKQDTLTFDVTPTQDSTNPVESGGVYSAIATLTSQVTGKQNKITTSNHWHSLPVGAVNWEDNQCYYTYSHSTGDRTIIDIDPTQTDLWAQFGVYAYSESNNYILFKCKEVPTTALQFKITTMDVLKISD